MKRVQMILEEWQHNWLSEQAKLANTTISALLRELLTEAIERKQADDWHDDPIWGIIGLGEGPDDGITSENLDEFLYAPQQPQRLLKIAENAENRDE